METTVIGMETLTGPHILTIRDMLTTQHLRVDPVGTEMTIMVPPAVANITEIPIPDMPDTTNK